MQVESKSLIKCLPISSNKHPRRLFNIEALRGGVY